jgi:hypothetical protein
MDRRSQSPRMWRMYVQTLVPDATSEPGQLAAPRPIHRRVRDRRLRRERVRLAHRLGAH